MHCEVDGCHQRAVERITLRKWRFDETRALCADHLALWRGAPRGARVRILGGGGDWPVYHAVRRLEALSPGAVIVLDDWSDGGAGTAAASLASSVLHDSGDVDAVIAVGAVSYAEMVEIQDHPTWWPAHDPEPPAEWLAAVRRSS